MSYQDTFHDALSPEKSQVLSDVLESGIDVKLQLRQHHAEMARLLALEIMEEVVGLAGERCSRDKPHGGRYCRWDCNPGSIAVGEERASVRIPRRRDQVADRERPLESYQRMKEPMTEGEQLQRAVLLGLSVRLRRGREPVRGRVWRQSIDGEPAVPGAQPRSSRGVREP